MDYGYAAQANSETMALAGQIRRPTIMERLTQEREVLTTRLAEVNAAIASLEGNPGMMDVIEKISRVTSF